MDRVLRILLVDTPDAGSHESIARVRTLASGKDAEVTVLSTIDFIPEVPPSAGLDIDALIREESLRRADAIVEDLKRDRVNASSRVRVGIPFVEVIKEAHAIQADFVVKVSESMASKRSNIGTTDLNLLRQCPCPVWITRRRERAPYEQVFAAVDPSDQSLGRAPELDDKIVEHAARIARSDGAKLTIVHAWRMIGEGMLRGRSRFPASEIRQMLNETRETREQRVREIARPEVLNGVDYEIRMIKGDPREVLPQVVERKRADLLVMGTVVRTGIQGFFVGSTAEEVIQQVGCAILALKPRDFVSTINLE